MQDLLTQGLFNGSAIGLLTQGLIVEIRVLSIGNRRIFMIATEDRVFVIPSRN